MRRTTAVFTPTLKLKKNSFLAYLLFFDKENPVYISSRVCCFSSPWVLLDVICLHPAITFVLLTGTGYTNNTVIPDSSSKSSLDNSSRFITHFMEEMPDFAAYAV